MSIVSFNISSKMRTATIVMRLANTAATGSRCYHSQLLCTRGRGPTNLIPSGLLTKFSGSYAREGMDRMDRMESITFTRRISSSSIFSDQISKPEPETRRLYGSSECGAKPDKKATAKSTATAKSKARSINKQIVTLGRDGKWKDILILYKEEKQHFDAVNHATVMSQLGRIRQMRKDDPLFKAFLDDLSAKLHPSGIAWIAKTQTLANIVHAIAKIGLKSNSIAMKIVRLVDDYETAEWLFDNGNSQEVANCVWACGKLGIKSPNLFQFLDQRAEWLLDNGNPQEVANCAWACGTLGIESPNLFRSLDQRAQCLVDNWTSQQMANCVWACGKLGFDPPNLFRLLDERAEWLVDNGTPQEVAICVWACGTLGVESPSLFQLLDKRAQWLVDNGNPQELANCVWACGKLGVESQNLFQLLDKRAQWLLDGGNRHHIDACVWACGKLAIEPPNLFRKQMAG